MIAEGFSYVLFKQLCVCIAARQKKKGAGLSWARDPQRSQLCMFWAEVFCGSGDEGRWVHVDPLLNWLDKPEQVEGGGVR